MDYYTHDSSKDLVICVHCHDEQNLKTKYRKKNLEDHTKTKHPGKTVNFRLPSNKTIIGMFEAKKSRLKDEAQVESEIPTANSSNADHVDDSKDPGVESDEEHQPWKKQKICDAETTAENLNLPSQSPLSPSHRKSVSLLLCLGCLVVCTIL